MPFSVFSVQIDDEAVFGLGALQVRIFFGHLLAQGWENLKVGIVAGDGHPLGVDDAFGQIFQGCGVVHEIFLLISVQYELDPGKLVLGLGELRHQFTPSFFQKGDGILSATNLADFLDGKSGLPQGLDPVCRKG